MSLGECACSVWFSSVHFIMIMKRTLPPAVVPPVIRIILKLLPGLECHWNWKKMGTLNLLVRGRWEVNQHMSSFIQKLASVYFPERIKAGDTCL